MSKAVFARRPDNGCNIGTKVQFKVNMFKLANNPTQLKGKIYHYDIEIEDSQGRKGKNATDKKNPFPAELNRMTVARLIKGNENIFRNVPIAYDGKSNIYTTQPIKFDGQATEQTFMDVSYIEKDNDKKRVFHVTVKLVVELSMADMAKYLTGQSIEMPQPILAALDIMLMHLPAYHFISIPKRSYLFSPDNFVPIGSGLVAHHGYYTSVRPCKGGLFVNFDLATAAFYEPKPVVEAVVEVCGVRDGLQNLQRWKANEFDMRTLRSFLVQAKVSTNYLGGQKRVNRVFGVGKPANETFFFLEEGGQQTTVHKYFQSKHNIQLKYPNLPVLITNASGKSMIPMELCTIMPGVYYKRKLNPDATAAMIKVSCTRPDERATKIQNGLKEIQFDQAPQLNDLGLQMTGEMVKVQGYCLPPPDLLYGSNKKIKPDAGAWNLRDLKFALPAKFPCWGVLCLAGGRFVDERKVSLFVSELIKMANSLGMQCDPKIMPPILMTNLQRERLDIPSYMNRLNEKVKETFKGNMGFVLCVMDDRQNVEAYRQVKCFSDSTVGFASQCFLAKNLGRERGPSPQYLGNLLLKINAKLGGRNVVPEKNLSKYFAEPTIIFGADVTHPGQRKSVPSIVAVVASHDPFMSKYSGILRSQDSNKEDIVDLQKIVKEHLSRFYAANKLKPARLIFFRDGVSEGQFEQIYAREVTAIKAACQELQQDYKPAISFIVVQKRHHVRFLPSGPNSQTDRSGNIKAGTVIDSEIVSPTGFDFYLQSHAGIQGTSRPAHFYVLLDENGFTSNKLAEFINASCYINARCTRAVSIPPAVYYAHLLAYRGRILSKGDWDSDSSDVGSVKSGRSVCELLPIHQNLQVNNPMFFV